MKSWKKKQEKKQLPKGMKITHSLLVALLAAGAVSVIAYQKLHIRRPASDKHEDIMKFSSPQAISGVSASPNVRNG